jgi:hypothetical protein
MKKLILLFVLCSIPSWGAVSWVKATQNSNAAGSTIAATIAPTNSGDLIIIHADGNVTTQTATIAATGWSFNVLVGKTTTTSTLSYAWWAFAPSTASATITVTFSSTTNFHSILVDEWTGMDTVTPISGAAASATGSSVTPTVNVTPADNNTGLWGGSMDSITAVGAGFFKGADDTQQDWTEHQVIAGGSGVAQTVSFTGSSTWLIFAAAIKPAGAAAPACALSISLMGVGCR